MMRHRTQTRASTVVATTVMLAGVLAACGSHVANEAVAQDTARAATSTLTGSLQGLGGKCLDVAGGPGQLDNGRRVQMYDCLDNDNQRWTLENGELRGLGGKCLDVAGGAGEFDKSGDALRLVAEPKEHVGTWDG